MTLRDAALGLYSKEDKTDLARVLHQLKAEGAITATPAPGNSRDSFTP